MKKIGTIFGISCVLLMMVFSSGATPADSKDISADIAKLKKEVLELRERIKTLENRLEKAIIIIPDKQPVIYDLIHKTPESFHQHRFIPKGWKQKEFNGHLYYVIPLDQDANLPRYSDK
jgi:hypothetical protein